MGTVSGRQFCWGSILLKSNGGVYQGQLGADGNRAGRTMAKAGLTARRACRADAKAEHNELLVGIRCCKQLTAKSYSGDNRLVGPTSPYLRSGSAPRCRLILSWRWRSCQGFGCSPIKKIRELGSNRRCANRATRY